MIWPSCRAPPLFIFFLSTIPSDDTASLLWYTPPHQVKQHDFTAKGRKIKTLIATWNNNETRSSWFLPRYVRLSLSDTYTLFFFNAHTDTPNTYLFLFSALYFSWKIWKNYLYVFAAIFKTNKTIKFLRINNAFLQRYWRLCRSLGYDSIKK